MSIFEEEDIKSEDKVKNVTLQPTVKSIANCGSGQIPSCLSFFNEWRSCSSSQRQFRHYYIYGTLSKCEQEQSNWTNCLSWKTSRDNEARKSILEYLRKKEEEKNMKPSAVVWKFRRDPAKGWNENSQE